VHDAHVRRFSACSCTTQVTAADAVTPPQAGQGAVVLGLQLHLV